MNNYSYIRLTPYEAHEAACLISSIDNNLDYDNSREILYKGYQEGIVYGVIEGEIEIKNLVGVGIKVEGNITTYILPEITNQVKQDLQEILTK